MTEFFSSIWDWLVANKDGILTFFSSGEFVALISAIVVLFKQAKSVKENTKSTKELNTTIEETRALKESINDAFAKNAELVASLIEENTKLKTHLANVQDATDKLLVKTNAMLDVQSLAYSNLRDEASRVAIGNVITNAKYSETAQRAELKNQLKALQDIITETNNATNEKVTEAVKAAKSLVESPSEMIVNSEDVKVTRY